MLRQVTSSRLIVKPDDERGFVFGRSGRLLGAEREGWRIARGLDGRLVARFKDLVREMGPEEGRALLAEARRALAVPPRGALFDEDGRNEPEMQAWVGRARCFDHGGDAENYQKVYRPVGILPPDQYAAVVLQATEGCAWNRCSFCSFYRGQKFRVKSYAEFTRHVGEVKEFLGDDLSYRNSVFLGEANALAAPVELLEEEMALARAALVPSMEDFRGFYAFAESAQALCRSGDDFARLKKAGLTRVDFGLETGDAELRQKLGKPGTVTDVENAARAARSAGLAVGVILMTGVGGRLFFDRHVRCSLEALRRLGLKARDMVFFSCLLAEDDSPYRKEGAGWGDLTESEMNRQQALFRTGLTPGLRAVSYDVRGFVYA